MNVAAYEALRKGEVEGATAQLCQNLKCKLQAVLQGGDRSSAWLLTGLLDPFEESPYAGSRREMAVIAAYQKEMGKLAKMMSDVAGPSTAKGSEDG